MAAERIVRLKAPAKINLGLVVGLPRSDGFHDLTTAFVRVNLCDEVEIASRTDRNVGEVSKPRLFATGKSLPPDCRLQIADYRMQNAKSDLPTGKDNLCVQAARRFQQATGIRQPVEIRLTKRIPLGAGLGGGSSDAAAVLKGMNRLFGKPLSSRELHDLALELGSDVPFFLRRSACIASGRGDVLTPTQLPKLHILLHLPGFPVSTPWAYGELDRLRRNPERKHQGHQAHQIARGISGCMNRFPSGALGGLGGEFPIQNPESARNPGFKHQGHQAHQATKGISEYKYHSPAGALGGLGGKSPAQNPELVAGLTQQAFCLNIAIVRLKAGRFGLLADLLHNSFEEPVFRRHPGLRTIKARFLKAGADAALLSGSGSALFALVRPSRVRQVERALELKGVSFLSLETMA